MSGGKSTLIKGWGNFSCSRLHNIYLAHSLLGPRDNLFSGEFHLLQCQKLVRLAEYPVRKTRMQTKYSTKYPLPRLQVFFFSFDHKLHVGAASAKPKYNSPSILKHILNFFCLCACYGCNLNLCIQQNCTCACRNIKPVDATDAMPH